MKDFFLYRMTNKLRIEDPLEGEKGNHKQILFTWSNLQSRGRKLFYRLDRIYANKEFLRFFSQGSSRVFVYKEM